MKGVVRLTQLKKWPTSTLGKKKTKVHFNSQKKEVLNGLLRQMNGKKSVSAN
jgi:hypothetical protein